MFKNLISLVDILREYNFSVNVVEWEDYTVEESLRITRDSDLLVGVHGNGLTQAFCQAPGAVLLIFVPYVSNPARRKEIPGVNINLGRTSCQGAGYASWGHEFGLSTIVHETQSVAYEPQGTDFMKRTVDLKGENLRPLVEKIRYLLSQRKCSN